jgi:hypothetical protein
MGDRSLWTRIGIAIGFDAVKHDREESFHDGTFSDWVYAVRRPKLVQSRRKRGARGR